MNHSRLISVAIGLAALPVGAWAQDTSSSVLEEIVVTAERREASLQTVPVPVTAITAESLQNKQVTEARDLARYAPSLKMFNNITTPTNLSPSLRGSLQQDATLIVAESPFGIYVDDVYIARLNGNNVTLADIERVEVLRGPQGTLYGRNTLTGAIKFISRSPGEDSWGEFNVGGGSFETRRASFSVGGPMRDGWAGSLSALYSTTDGRFFNAAPSVNDKSGLERNWAVRGKLRYMGIENLDMTLSLSVSDSDNDAGQLIPATTPNVPSAGCSAPPFTACRQFTSDDLVPTLGKFRLSTGNLTRSAAFPELNRAPFGKTQQTISSLNLAYDFGDTTLKSITGYVHTRDSFFTDFSGLDVVSAAQYMDVEQYSQELQLLGKSADGKLNYLLGAYAFEESGSQDFTWFFLVPLNRSGMDTKTTSLSVFAQADYQLTENLKGTAGVRYTQDKKSFDFYYNGVYTLPLWVFVNGGPAPTGTVTFDNKYTETTPRIGLDYTVPTTSANIDSLLLYVSAAKGFKSGGYNGIALFNFNDAKSAYAPESNWTYEAGIKTDLMGNRLRINANYFLAKAEDLALNATVGVGAFPVQNSGTATIKGLEAEITAVPTDGLTLFLSGTFLMDGSYDSFRAGSAPANAPIIYKATAIVPQTPDYSFTVGFDYGFDTPVGRVSLGADWFQTDDYITASTNDFKVKGHGQGNAFVGISLSDQWNLRASVKNFTDEYVLQTGSRALGGFIPLRPREYQISVGYKLN